MISRSLRSSSPRSGGGAGALPSRALLTVVVLLLIGAAVLFWLPQSLFDQVGATISRWTTRDAPTDQAAVSPRPETAAPGTVTESACRRRCAVAVAQPPAEPVAVEEPVAAAAAQSNDLIVFVAREDSWINVTEAGGKQLLHRTIKAGETVGLTGNLPLSVVVGRAAGVQVQLHGKPFDLAPITRSGGVARFDVKS